MPQEQLSRRVLEVDEERFKGLVRELAKGELLAERYTRKEQLAITSIILGHIRRGERRYEVEAEVPYCREYYGDGRVVLLVQVTMLDLYFGYHCIAIRTIMSIDVAVIWYGGKTTAFPWKLYRLYELLHKRLGTGTRPLLDLAMKAEEEGDREVAGILRKLYAILEASKDRIREIEGADYSSAVAELEKALEKEAERKVEEAVKLLREAKRAAEEGDIDRLLELYKTEAVETPPYVITLGDIIYYLRTGLGSDIRDLLRTYRSYSSMLVNTLREEDIYDTLIRVAEHFGLETRRK